MKNNARLLLITAALLLASCGSGNKNSSNPIDSGSSTPESSLNSSSSEANSEGSSSSTSRRPIGGSSSSKSSSTASSSSVGGQSSTSTSVDTSDDIPQRFKINLHAASDNEGLTVTAPSSGTAGRNIELTVNLQDGYVLEYIRLNAPTADEGGVRIKPNDQGKYIFEMPNKSVDIYYKGVKGYSVTFASNHATAKLAADSAEYDLWGAGYPVYVCKASVESGYYFKGFEVKDAKGNKIQTWDDAPDQVGFLMPASNVVVTAIGAEINTSISAIAGTYSNGTSIDMNSLDGEAFELSIGLDMKVKFTTDWTNPDWVGSYTYENNELNADITNISLDGYFTETTRHLKVKFLNEGKYLAVEFSSATATYRYMFGKASEGLMAKKLYMSKLQNGDYTRAHRLVSFSAMSGDFFTYVNPTRTAGEYHLTAYEKGTNTKAFALVKDKEYTMTRDDGTAVINVAYDGTNITVSDPTPITPGPGGETGGETGGEEQTTAPFLNKTYANSEIRIYDDDWYDYDEYTFTIKFSATYGKITSVCIKSDGWSPLLTEKKAEDLSYTYDAETGAIEVVGLKSGNQTTILSYQDNGTIIYRGKMWYTDYQNATKNTDCILRVVG